MEKSNVPETADGAPLPAENAAQIVDVPAWQSMSLQERIDGYNAENAPLLEKFHIVLASEAYLKDGKIESRPVVFPREQLPKSE